MSLNEFIEKNKNTVETIFKPLLVAVLLSCMGIATGGFTVWMAQKFVAQTDFNEYIAKSEALDKTKEEVYAKRFELTQARLETIINSQTSFTEQLKSFNLFLVGLQDQDKDFAQRLLYLERRDNLKKED